MFSKLVVPTLVTLLLGACVTVHPIPAGESFRLDLGCHGGGERYLSMDVTPDFGSPLGQEVALDDVTTLDDSVNAVRRFRIGGLRPPSGRRGLPTKGHIEWRELANRSPVELVLEYKGHHDVYHLAFPATGGLTVDPSQGEFTRSFVKP